MQRCDRLGRVQQIPFQALQVAVGADEPQSLLPVQSSTASTSHGSPRAMTLIPGKISMQGPR